MVFITHDLAEALKLGDHIVIMRDGRSSSPAGRRSSSAPRPTTTSPTSSATCPRRHVLTLRWIMRGPTPTTRPTGRSSRRRRSSGPPPRRGRDRQADPGRRGRAAASASSTGRAILTAVADTSRRRRRHRRDGRHRGRDAATDAGRRSVPSRHLRARSTAAASGRSRVRLVPGARLSRRSCTSCSAARDAAARRGRAAVPDAQRAARLDRRDNRDEPAVPLRLRPIRAGIDALVDAFDDAARTRSAGRRSSASPARSAWSSAAGGWRCWPPPGFAVARRPRPVGRRASTRSAPDRSPRSLISLADRHPARDPRRRGARAVPGGHHADPRRHADHADVRLPRPDRRCSSSSAPAAAAIATLIYAIPPAIRITALGIRGVPATRSRRPSRSARPRWQVAAQGPAAAGPPRRSASASTRRS